MKMLMTWRTLSMLLVSGWLLGGAALSQMSTPTSQPKGGPVPCGSALGEWAGALDEIPSKVKNDLRSRYPKDRQGAVRKLAKIGSDEAWDLVLRALSDELGQVADEAQVQLASAACPASVWERLLGEDGLDHKDEWVQLRAAEVLGLSEGPVPAQPLVAELSKKRPMASVGILRALERLQARGGLDWGKNPDRGRSRGAKAVAGLIGEDGMLGGQALLTLAVVDGARAEDACAKAERSKSAYVRAAALAVLVQAQHPNALNLARKLVGDADAGVRSLAQDALVSLGTKPALLALIERLEAEPRQKLQLELLPDLRQMTDFKGMQSVDVWRQYAADLPADWQAEPKNDLESSEPKPEEGQSMAPTAGLPTYSDRIVYLFDFSGSIWNEREGGKTRKELLDPLFDRTLDSLSADTRFNLGPYTKEVSPWQRGLTEAKAKRVQNAQKFIDEIKISGPGDFYHAVEWAKEHGEVDTICVLTDGAPTGGRRWAMEGMVNLLLDENRLRHIRYDVVLVDCPKGLTRHWQRLADATGGTLQTLDL